MSLPAKISQLRRWKPSVCVNKPQHPLKWNVSKVENLISIALPTSLTVLQRNRKGSTTIVRGCNVKMLQLLSLRKKEYSSMLSLTLGQTCDMTCHAGISPNMKETRVPTFGIL
ncbi:hypothetical protein COOONC_00065 [Cooperia oncophora]